MAIITTQRNTIYAYDPQPDDVMVQVGWKAPVGDGKHSSPITLPLRPISEYAACIEFAKEIADGLEHEIHVVPFNHREILRTNRWTPYADFIANMNDQQSGELRQIIIASCTQIMRDCGDHAVRAEAYDQLVKLKVVLP